MSEPISMKEAHDLAIKVAHDAEERLAAERQRDFEAMRCDDCKDHEAELTRLRTELAEAQVEKTRWETIAWDTKHELDSRKAQIDQYATERDTLRTELAGYQAKFTVVCHELAEAQAAREQTIKNWEADIRAMNANRDTLRTELAEVRAGLAKEAAVRAMAVEMGKEWANQLADMILERDTLRQQLAVAREGLEKVRDTTTVWYPDVARDTLAKLEQMENRNA
jgi:chromosome segregation ATPase